MMSFHKERVDRETEEEENQVKNGGRDWSYAAKEKKCIRQRRTLEHLKGSWPC